MRTSNLTISAIAVIATLAAMPAIAATSAKDQAQPTPIKHAMTMRHHRASLQMRENGAPMPRGVANPGDVNANLNLSNANASASRPPESLATQLGATVTRSGDASDPVCKPGDVVPMPDGQMHSCQ